MTGIKLEPCPFCGGPAEIVDIDEGENAGGSCVCCTSCLASGNVEFEFKENFVSNWNRRAVSEHVEPTPEVGPITDDILDQIAAIRDGYARRVSEADAQIERFGSVGDRTELSHASAEREKQSAALVAAGRILWILENAAAAPKVSTPSDPVVQKLVEALRIFSDPANWTVNGRCDPNSGNFDAIALASAALALVGEVGR